MSRPAGLLAMLSLVAWASACSRPPPPGQAAPETPAAGAETPIEPVDPGCQVDVPPQRLLRLSPIWYANTVAALFGEPPAAPTLPPPLAETISEREVETLAGTARAFVARGGHRAYAPCDLAAGYSGECLRAFVDRFGRRAFRRPLADEERTALLEWAEALRVDAAIDPPVSFAELVDGLAEVIVQSPQLVYLLDEGVGDDALPEGVRLTTGYERAARLSFFLTDTGPSEALLAAAAEGAFDTEGKLREQATKLLDSSAGRARVRRFASTWLALDATGRTPSLEERAKNAQVFPFDSPALRRAMRAEVEALYERSLYQGGGFEAVLTSRQAWVDPALAELYGVDAPAPGTSDWVTLDPAERAGILTRAAYLAQHAGPAHSSPILRGVHLYRRVLCVPLGDPPPNVNETPPAEPNEGELVTTRRQTELRTAAASCMGCHSRINPLGFTLESFDAIGGFRTQEPVQTSEGVVLAPVNATAEVIAGDIAGWVQGPVELSERLAASALARECHALLWFEQAVARTSAREDACALQRLRRGFRETGDLHALLVEIASSAPMQFVREGAP